jgi:hypothetical protein
MFVAAAGCDREPAGLVGEDFSGYWDWLHENPSGSLGGHGSLVWRGSMRCYGRGFGGAKTLAVLAKATLGGKFLRTRSLVRPGQVEKYPASMALHQVYGIGLQAAWCK